MKISNLYNARRLKETINLYGYKYTYKDYLKEAFAIIAGVIAVAYVYHLSDEMMCIIVIVSLFMIPVFVEGLYKSRYNAKRFNELSDYLSNILPIFNSKPKVIYTLKELKELTSGEIHEKIVEAINYIENTLNDPYLLRNGLKIISDCFNNSRVISVHRFLIDVEKCDSKNYQLISDSLYIDIENWIRRVCTYEKELLDKRNKLVILSLSSLFINSVFVYVYQNEGFFEEFINNSIYQISTTVFIATILLIITIAFSSMTGKWLIDDQLKINETKLTRTYMRYKGKDTRSVIQIVFTVVMLCGGGILYYLKLTKLAIVSWIMALVTNNLNRVNKIKAKKKLKEYFTVSFPLWLREVSLSIGNLTVLNSISNTTKHYEYPLRKELRNFVSEAGNNPTSIRPYNDFLSEYQVDGLRSSMRVLFSLNDLSKENIRERLSFLTQRNQELLAKSESIQNKDSLARLELLGFVPIVLFTMQTLVSMGLMLNYVIENLGGGNII